MMTHWNGSRNRLLKKDTGARALRAIIEEFMLDIMFEIPEGPGDRFCDDHPRVSGKTWRPTDRDAGVFYGGQEGGCSAGADGKPVTKLNKYESC